MKINPENIVLRYGSTICVIEGGQYFSISADGHYARIQSKLDILPIAPIRSKKPRTYNKRLKRSV